MVVVQQFHDAKIFFHQNTKKNRKNINKAIVPKWNVIQVPGVNVTGKKFLKNNLKNIFYTSEEKLSALTNDKTNRNNRSA